MLTDTDVFYQKNDILWPKNASVIEWMFQDFCGQIKEF